MDDVLLAKYDRRVPRYTSYPPATRFHQGVGAATYRRWLEETPTDASLSLYLHIPYCENLCWFCGCHTKMVRRYEPIATYLELLGREIDLIADILGGRRRVRHVHWGGGTPTIVLADDILALNERLRWRFEFAPDAEFAVEIDPRGLTADRVSALAAAGVTRASLGVQDVSPAVQRAVNRHQPFAVTARAAAWLRDAGIDALNVDLMYGLPRQTVARVVATVEAVLTLKPQRVAVFGYAHVPWMKRHQRLIDETELPGPAERFAQFAAASRRLRDAGYVAVGLDHFARPGDPLAVAARNGRLHRNFQGYTTDDASALLGIGASAIGMLPQGYVQNAVPVHAYRDAIEAGAAAVTRGIALDAEDRLRRDAIERLMCDGAVDLAAICRRHGCEADHFAAELAQLASLDADGLVAVDGHLVRVRDAGRALLRTVCAVFDTYLEADETHHAPAI